MQLTKCNYYFSSIKFLYSKTLILGFLFLFLFNFKSTGQANLSVVESAVKQYISEQNLPTADYSNYQVTSSHTSSTSGITHYYLRQQHKGIPIHNAVMSVHLLPNDKVLKINDQFLVDVASKVNTTQPTLKITEALQNVITKLQYSSKIAPILIDKEGGSEQKALYSKGSISRENIPVQLMYQITETGTLLLSWDFSVFEIKSDDWWSMRVDAQNGEILEKINWTIYCEFGVADCCEAGHNHAHKNAPSESYQATAKLAPDSYRVFPEPVESPLHGGRQLIINPADASASPFGWHDINGANGAEFTITRGNNVWAMEDANGDDGTGFSPDGTASLDFDFGLNLNGSPNSEPNRSAGITNLFYWNNLVHDVWYQYGFDEPSGNFQQNNYGNGGTGGDYVIADAQDGGGTNNANFSSPADGGNGYMQMYLWTGASAGTLTVNSPGVISGAYSTEAAQFGQGTFNVNGSLVIVSDGSAAPSEGCGALTNNISVSGNIAVVDRGSCEFGTKCLNAQNAGAVAVIVCNNVAGAPIAMGPGADGASVTIPAVMISQADCATIRAQIPTVNVNLASGSANSRDGDFDNGIVTHEYGHGISIRLTGGRNNSNCLSNSEQMGEGWSDWFGLMMTIEPGDSRNDVRPIGTFALGQPVTGSGIRTYPYTCDLNVNPHTYNDIAAEAVPHGVGSVWCAMLWEMTWDLIDAFGYDPDLHYGTGGNNIAMALVIEGLKLQPCSPGFVGGRDAIIAADIALYNGDHVCLIREAFARRGLGDNANEGSTASNTDPVQDFVSDCGPPSCDDGIKNQDEVGVDCGGEICPPCQPDACTDFDFNGIISYDANDNDQGTATVSNGGNEVLITGNGWKAIPINYTVTPSTVITFDFRSTVQGEIHEVGFDNDLIILPDFRIIVYGNQGVGSNFSNPAYTGSGNWETFTVPLGSVFTGTYQYLVLNADDDATGNGISEFRNLQIFEDNNGNLTCDAACASVDLDIFFDGFPAQTSWVITDDANGATVASSPNYGGIAGNTTISTSPACLLDGCYTLTFSDALNNGMCPFQSSAVGASTFITPGTLITPGSVVGTLSLVTTPGLCGNYSLTDGSGTVLASGGGSFGASESNQFCLNGGLAPKYANPSLQNATSKLINATLTVKPNLVKNELNISYIVKQDADININILDLSGKIVQQTPAANGFSNSLKLDVSNLSSGIYFVQMLTSNEVLTEKFIKN